MEEQFFFYRFVQSMGVSVQNMQVMKVFFFYEEDVLQQLGKVTDYIGFN